MRLFVAIELPPAWCEAAAETARKIERVAGVPLRLVDATRLHLTLRFLGEVAPVHLEALQRALLVQAPPAAVELTLGRAGTFGADSRTSLVYLGIEDDGEGLRALVARVEAAVRAAGMPGDDRPFLPHVTIARLPRSQTPDARRAVVMAARSVPPPDVEPMHVREVVLVHSILGAQPRYEVLARISDGGG